jgi:hemoglobin-like flavoprotein
MTDVSYSTVMQVSMSWDKFKTFDQAKVGRAIFTRLLELEPKARDMFKLGPPGQDAQSSQQFEAHARTIFDMIDLIVCALGPDLEPIESDLIDLGRRHVRHGVPSSYLHAMERSVIDSMSTMLGIGYSESDREAWKIIFKFLTSHMIRGMKEAGGK